MADQSRREFLKKTAVVGIVLPFVRPSASAFSRPSEKLELHVFSKHLQFLDYGDMARAAAETGFDGIDLAVRPGGHVEPDNVRQGLPRAVDTVRQAGLKATMMTTSVDDTDDPEDRAVLKTASESGIRFYRMNWLSYDQGRPMTDVIAEKQLVVRELSGLNRQLGLVGCYQNHASNRIGASIWEVKQLLDTADPDHVGAQYDIRHAMVEGAHSWENGLRLIQERIRTIVLKDFKWGKVDGRWRVMNTPIGEGMVDFNRYFRLLKEYEINVPVSVHFEYPLGGAEHGEKELTISRNEVYKAMKKDIQAIRELWENA